MRRLVAGVLFLVVVVAGTTAAWLSLGLRDGTDGATREVLGAARDVATVPLATATAAVQPARVLPITPIPIEYRVLDPAFEALPGARVLYGTYEGGSYQIEVPDAWNGSVVYFAHGFRGNPAELTVSVPALRQHFIGRGYAWAASSYSRNGYEPGVGARDTLALQKVFDERVGAPRYSYIYGESMGGNVATFSLEQYPTAYDGALTECGVVSGREILEYFASWVVLAEYFSGVSFMTDVSPSVLDVMFSTRVMPALGSPEQPTGAGQQFIEVIKHMTGGERAFFEQGLVHQFGANFTIVAHAAELAGAASGAASNERSVYSAGGASTIDAAALNRGVTRLAPGEAYRSGSVYPEFQPMTGRIERPLLTLHGTGDLFVPISLEQSYRSKVAAAGREDLLVQRAIRRAGHCNFSPEERQQAFDDLTAWVELGVRPAGEDLSGDLVDAGLQFTAPLEQNDPLAP